MYGGRISFASPMLFAFGFLSMFLIGGLTGIMLAAAPFDFQFNDSYFVVGHFHWVLIGGTLFGTLRRHPLLVSESDRPHAFRADCPLAILVAVCWFLYLTFGPMHISGMLGMPRRIYTYDADRGWEIWNQLTTLGAIDSSAELLAIFVINLFWSYWHGKPAGDDPWNAWTSGMVHDVAAAGI